MILALPPTPPLENPRHEAFAFALASGASPADAYDSAGFSSKNRKARAQALSEHPDILARIERIYDEMPDVEDIHWNHGRPFTTMPESRERMSVWVWQVMQGARKLTPAQLQAAKLFTRLRSWDREPCIPEPPMRITDSGFQSLAILSAVQAARESQLIDAPLATEADNDAEPQLAPILPNDDDDLPTEAKTGTDGDKNPHAQSPDNQSITPKLAKMGIKKFHLPTSPKPQSKPPPKLPLNPLPIQIPSTNRQPRDLQMV